jgi:hypothetical protein
MLAAQRMGALIGDWHIDIPKFGVRGRGSGESTEDGVCVVFRWRDLHPAPNATWIIGADDATDICTALYHDERGVSRVYQMSFEDNVWRMWRNAPGFHQRLAGALDEAGTTIRATLEMSEDGESWKPDFDLIFTRVS